ncbi:hypothetical protein ACH0C8_15535, partial [Acetobacter lovaniensis]|uniref:hypothetical protein n=1 Tax=Acetobacter lovaniensis TaxID=104100 RepID=UPI00376FD65E
PNASHEVRHWMPAYAITIQVITTILLTIRLISRFTRTGGQVGLDDALITIAWVFGLAMTVLVVVCKSVPMA